MTKSKMTTKTLPKISRPSYSFASQIFWWPFAGTDRCAEFIPQQRSVINRRESKGQSLGSTIASTELDEIFPSRTCFLPEGQIIQTSFSYGFAEVQFFSTL